MEKSNKNHPVQGSSITVDPIRSLKDIRKIKRKLKDSSRDLLLFTMGINNGLRVSDILALKVEDVIDLDPGETLKIKEKKTGKRNVLMINKEVHKILSSYLEEIKLDDTDFLFKSRKGENNPLSTSYTNQLMKKWTKGMKGNFGSHTLRKTFGYVQRVQFGVGFDILCKRFGHSSPAITLRYLGIEDKEVNGILLNEI